MNNYYSKPQHCTKEIDYCDFLWQNKKIRKSKSKPSVPFCVLLNRVLAYDPIKCVIDQKLNKFIGVGLILLAKSSAGRGDAACHQPLLCSSWAWRCCGASSDWPSLEGGDTLQQLFHYVGHPSLHSACVWQREAHRRRWKDSLLREGVRPLLLAAGGGRGPPPHASSVSQSLRWPLMSPKFIFTQRASRHHAVTHTF